MPVTTTDSITLPCGTITVGDLLTTGEQFNELPVGTKVQYLNDLTLWVKYPNEWWGIEGDRGRARSLQLNRNRVVSIPAPPVAPESLYPRPEGTLTFEARRGGFSLYRTEGGEEVLLANGRSTRMLVPFDSLLDDLDRLWAEDEDKDQAGFLAALRASTTEPLYVADIRFCNDCPAVRHVNDLYLTHDGEEVCEDCVDNYYTCNRCEGRFTDTTTTLDDREVCRSCRDNYYSYCDWCDGYWRDGDGHYHEDDLCCESPAREFLVRNDGNPPLAEDTRVTVSLPAGVISAVGINAIAAYLQNQSYYLDEGSDLVWPDPSSARHRMIQLSYLLDRLGDQWQTRQGNYTKRLSRLAYKEFTLNLSPEVLSSVGNIGREHSTGRDFHVEVTRDLNLPRQEFFHGGSCWWSEYAESRCALKTNGGFGLRSFTADGCVSGRAWVMPLRMDPVTECFGPTFDTLTPDAFVTFNGYGELEGYSAARIVAHMAGWTYRKIGWQCGVMYVNNASGYLVAPEEIASRYTDAPVGVSVDTHSDLFNQEMKKKEISHVQ